MRPHLRLVVTVGALGMLLMALPAGVALPADGPAGPGYRIAVLAGTDPGGVFGTSDIFEMDLDGTGWRRITSGPFRKEQPDWSPDGSRLVYTSTGGEFGPASIFTVRADGTGLRRLTRGNHYDIHPDWSPDGSLIAFSSDQAGNPNYEIYTIHPDGTGIARITNLRGSDGDPAWSPDGTMIAFDHDFEQLWVVNADGSSPRMLTACRPGGCYEKDQPAWSPDGSTIVFLWGKDPHYQLRTIAPDGTGERLLFDCRRPCLGVADPQWSPDGRLVSFTYIDAHADRHAYAMHSDGTGVRPLWPSGKETCCVAWRPA